MEKWEEKNTIGGGEEEKRKVEGAEEKVSNIKDGEIEVFGDELYH